MWAVTFTFLPQENRSGNYNNSPLVEKLSFKAECVGECLQAQHLAGWDKRIAMISMPTWVIKWYSDSVMGVGIPFLLSV